MPLLESLVRIYAPHLCLGCGVERDRLLCEACGETMSRVPSRCYRCKAVTRDFAVCNTCRRYTPLRHVYVVTQHEGVAKELLHHAKYERARAGLDEMAMLMAPLLASLPSGTLLVPIPTATKRVRQRGYDQSVVLARRLSRSTKLVVGRILARMGQAHQVGAGRSARLAHLHGAFRAVHAELAADGHIVLVDDVLTTGATLETAAKLLRKAGARQVDAIVFTQPT